MILDFMESRVNTDETKDNYMIVYASQRQISDELGFTREYISHCISRMAENENCIFEKVRQGLNKANYYIMSNKKKLIDLLKEIHKTQQEERQTKADEKQSVSKKIWKNKFEKADSFNHYEQRTYDYNDLEKKLLGWT